MNLAETQAAFAAHLRNPAVNPAPADIEDRRMQIYRDLFYNNVENFIASGFPVIRKLFSDEKWHRMVRDFFSNHESHTPYFPRLCEEFLAYLDSERQTEADDPPWLNELAHYEWSEAGVHISNEITELSGVDRNGDLLTAVPVVSATAWLQQYQWPVHQLGPDYRPETAPEQPTLLVVYRNRQDEVKFLEINPVTARLIQLMQENPDNENGMGLVRKLAVELGQNDPQALVPHASDILEKLRQREILLGSR